MSNLKNPPSTELGMNFCGMEGDIDTTISSTQPSSGEGERNLGGIAMMSDAEQQTLLDRLCRPIAVASDGPVRPERLH